MDAHSASPGLFPESPEPEKGPRPARPPSRPSPEPGPPRLANDSPRFAIDSPRFARVAVALPVDRALHYRIPDALLGRVHVGSRVRASLAGRPVAGTVVAIDREPEVARVVDLLGVVEPSARVGADLIEL